MDVLLINLLNTDLYFPIYIATGRATTNEKAVLIVACLSVKKSIFFKVLKLKSISKLKIEMKVTSKGIKIRNKNIIDTINLFLIYRTLPT